MSIIDQILVDDQPVNKAALRRYLAARESVNLRDFGAVGDGIADDSAAIQAAVSAARGQPVWVPPGDYLLGRQLIFTAPAKTHAPAPRLYGAGPAASRLLYRGRGAAMLVTQETGYRFLKSGVLSGLAFAGNDGGADQHGLSFSGDVYKRQGNYRAERRLWGLRERCGGAAGFCFMGKPARQRCGQ